MYEHAKCTSTLWVLKDHRGAWKTGHNARRGETCASWWRKTLRPKRVRFLAIDAPIVDRVDLSFKKSNFLTLMHPLCEFSWRKQKGKARKMDLGFASISSWHESVVYCAALPHQHTLLHNTQKSRYLEFRRASAPQWRDQALHTLVLMCSWCDVILWWCHQVHRKRRYDLSSHAALGERGLETSYMTTLAIRDWWTWVVLKCIKSAVIDVWIVKAGHSSAYGIDNLQNYCLGTRYGARSRSRLCRRLSISLVRNRHGLEKFLEHHFIPIPRRFNPHDLPTDLLRVQDPFFFFRGRRPIFSTGNVDGVA